MKKIFKISINPNLNSRGFADQYYYCKDAVEALNTFKHDFGITEIEDNAVFVVEMDIEHTINMLNWYVLHFTQLTNDIKKLNIGKNILS